MPLSGETPNGTYWRIGNLERRVEAIERLRPDVLADRIDNHVREFAEIRDEIRGLRRALYTFALSIAGGAIAFVWTVTQVLG